MPNAKTRAVPQNRNRSLQNQSNKMIHQLLLACNLFPAPQQRFRTQGKTVGNTSVAGSSAHIRIRITRAANIGVGDVKMLKLEDMISNPSRSNPVKKSGNSAASAAANAMQWVSIIVNPTSISSFKMKHNNCVLLLRQSVKVYKRAVHLESQSPGPKTCTFRGCSRR